MRFREEVISKIFTYITVIVLLGIVIFEAWSLQAERSDRRRAEEEAASVQKNLDTMISMNATLQAENKELQIFQNTWLPYAAFVDSSEVLTLKTDLFVRPDLIPEEASEAARERYKALLADAEELPGTDGRDDPDASEEKDAPDASEGKADVKEDAEEKEESEKKLEFQFDNPDGEDIFFPLSIDSVSLESCLVYTVAFEKTEDLSIELIYEITFENGNDAVRDENGEVEWRCIAYNAGDGWNGIRPERSEQ